MSGKCNQCGNNPCVCGENFISSTLLYPCISLRDYFAAKAMQGLISACNSDGIWTGCGDKKMNDNMAITAYMVADSMLKARGEK